VEGYYRKSEAWGKSQYSRAEINGCHKHGGGKVNWKFGESDAIKEWAREGWAGTVKGGGRAGKGGRRKERSKSQTGETKRNRAARKKGIAIKKSR